MDKVLITGGTGFIGSHVATHLHESGKYDVHICDRQSYAGKARNIAHLLPYIKVWIGDLKEWDFCQRLAAFDFDYVIHMASNTHVDHSIKNPRVFTLDNVLGTNQLLHAIDLRLKEHLPRKIICYSTDEVFGSTPSGEIFDETAAFKPSNAYSASKVGIEGLACSYWTTFGLPIVVVRPCNTYGPRQHPEKVIPRFVGQAMQGKPLTVHNDGTGSRDWLHTSDHAKAIEILMTRGSPGEAYNLPASDEHNDREIAERILAITLSKSELVYVPGRPGHDRRYWMAGGKIATLGWQPEMPFDKGFEESVRWNMKNQDWWDHDYLLGKEFAHARAEG